MSHRHQVDTSPTQTSVNCAGLARPLLGIQMLRAAAALAVVIYHMVHAEDVHGGGVSLLGGPAHFGYAGVDVFFVISGFIMAKITAGKFGSAKFAVEFLCRRAIRIVPLYWMCTLAIAAALALHPNALSREFENKSLFDSLLMIPQAGGPLLAVGWTLSYEIFFYAMAAIGLAIGSKSAIPKALLGWALVLLVLQAVPAYGPWTSVMTSPLSIEFIAGALVGLYWQRLPTALALPAIASGIAWMISAGFLLLEVPGHGQSDGIRTVAFGLPATLVIAGLARMEADGKAVAPEFLVQLGDASYSLYLTHLFVLSIVARLGSGLDVTGTATGNTILLITMFTACWIAALAVHKYVEKPLMTIGNRAMQPLSRRLAHSALQATGRN